MQHFIDEVIINVRSGNGGPGCVSFRREKYIPFGGPDGGNGGSGGSVIFLVKPSLRTLYHIKYKKNYFAKNGLPGMGKQKNGKDGDDMIIEIPSGASIYDNESNTLIKDLVNYDDKFILLKGGRGGKGNVHFTTSTNQAPRYAQPGIQGVEMTLKIVLKLIADVGLVGFPNAGKSTLLSVITNATPKIANYPFTTLSPNLGVFQVADNNYVMADIPGIIEGASEGAGLGLKFLKHIERTKILLYLIDLEDENYLEQYDKLKIELNQYSKKLAKKESVVVVNKIDIEDSEIKIKKIKKKIKENVFFISAMQRKGLKELLYCLKDIIDQVDK